MTETNVKRPDEELRHIADVLYEASSTSRPTETVLLYLSRSFTGAEVGLYVVERPAGVLRRDWSSAEAPALPASVPSADMIYLARPLVVHRDQAAPAALFREALAAQMPMVMTVPVLAEREPIGLLALAGEVAEELPALSWMETLAGFLSPYLQIQQAAASHAERQREEERLRQTYEALFENMKEGAVLLDRSLRVITVNTAAEWMFGYARAEVSRQPVENLLIGADRLPGALEKALEGIPLNNLGNVSFLRRNGQLFPALVQIVPIPAGEQAGELLVLIEDISENEEIRVKTQQLEQRAVLGEFTAIFAHEVRNPINNISSALQLLSTRFTEDDPNCDVVARMQNDCQRLNQLMESVLAFSRPMEPHFEALDLGGLLQRVLDRWRPRFARVHVLPSLEVNDQGYRARGDPRALEQVFTNLISNAVEAMSKQGGVLVARLNAVSEQERPLLEVTVSDNGPGIPPEVREHMFEPFVTNNPGGTGLGLAITKRIVTAHRGTISVQSYPGGTVFRVLLPVYEES